MVLSKDDIASVLSAFKKCDVYGKGTISFSSFDLICKKLDPGISTTDVFQLATCSDSCCINYTAFVQWLWDEEESFSSMTQKLSQKLSKANLQKTQKEMGAELAEAYRLIAKLKYQLENIQNSQTPNGTTKLQKSQNTSKTADKGRKASWSLSRPFGPRIQPEEKVMEPQLTYTSIHEELRARFPKINTREDYHAARSFVSRVGIWRVKEYLEGLGFIDEEGLMTTGSTPFNVFARVASGIMVQPEMGEEQEALGKYQEKFVICRNLPESDAQWANSSESWVGRASMSERHRFLTTKDLRWRWFNSLVFGMEDLDEAISELTEMKQAAQLYVKNRNWPGPVGLYFHAFPLNSVQSLHMHIVDLSRTGPTFTYLEHKNLPVDDIFAILISQQKGTSEHGRRVHEGSEGRAVHIEDDLPPCPLLGVSYSFLEEFSAMHDAIKGSAFAHADSDQQPLGRKSQKEDKSALATKNLQRMTVKMTSTDLKSMKSAMSIESLSSESEPSKSNFGSRILRKIRKQINLIDNSTIYGICNTIIKPSTKIQVSKSKADLDDPDEMLSYAEMGIRDGWLDQLGNPAFAKATHFVSHAWQYEFRTCFVQALGDWLEKSGTPPEKAYFWIDAFVVNQHESQEYPQKWWSTRFMQAVGEIGNTVLILDPWVNPLPFSRAWCIWELYCTAVTGARLHLAMSQKALEDFYTALTSSFEEVQTTLSHLDVSKSQCFHRHSQDMIHSEIRRTMGFTKMNEFVQTRLLMALIAVAKQRESELKTMQCIGVEATEKFFRFKGNMAAMLRETGNLGEAESSFTELHSLIENNPDFGADHPSSLGCLNQIAVTMHKHGKTAEAIITQRKCLQRRRDVLGGLHEDTLQSASNLAVILSEEKPVSSEAFEEARELYFLAVQGREKSLGFDHPRTLYTLSNLGKLLSEAPVPSRELFEEAEALHVRAVNRLIKVLHDTHPLTLTAMHNQGCHWILYSGLDGDVEFRMRGLAQLRKVLDSRTEKLGKEHPDTAATQLILHQAKSQGTLRGHAKVDLGLSRFETWEAYCIEERPHLATAEDFRVMRADLKTFGVTKLHNELVRNGYVDPVTNELTTGMQPFNLYARIVAGLQEQANMRSEQMHLGPYQDRYMVACNMPEANENWNSNNPVWVGKASMSKKHCMLIQKDLNWEWFNVLTFGMQSGCSKAIERLQEIKAAALQYVQSSEDWPEEDQVGLYFQAYSHTSVLSLHLHILDMDNVGPTWFNQRNVCLHINQALQALEAEQGSRGEATQDLVYSAAQSPERESSSSVTSPAKVEVEVDASSDGGENNSCGTSPAKTEVAESPRRESNSCDTSPSKASSKAKGTPGKIKPQSNEYKSPFGKRPSNKK